MQEEIASQISQRFRLKLSGEGRRETGRRHTDNLKAFESYMMGRSYVHRRTREDLLIATRYFEQAIKEDQNYTLAYTGLVEAYGSMGVWRAISSVARPAKKSAMRHKKPFCSTTIWQKRMPLWEPTMTLFAPYNFPDGDRESAAPDRTQPEAYTISSLPKSFALAAGPSRRRIDGDAQGVRARPVFGNYRPPGSRSITT